MLFNQPLLLICLMGLLFISLFAMQFLKGLFFNHRHLSLIAKSFYNYFYSIEKINHLRTNNWGFVPIDDEIMNYYHPDLQSGMQLYQELVKNSVGYVIDSKCSIAEIGCGKGAGAEFLINKFNPEKYIGVDYSDVAINFCKANYGYLTNAEFICADAHALPIASQSVDVVVNVESSHIYKDVYKFFKEVFRILKPGGRFLLTDFRVIKHYPISRLESLINECGFSITDNRIITSHIYESCLVASKRREELVNHASPWFLKRFFYHYAVLQGTKKFDKLGNGEIVYFMYHLQKIN